MYALIVRTESRAYGIPLRYVVETFRPLSVARYAHGAPHVIGAARVRGELTPIVDLGALVGDGASGAGARWVSLRVGEGGLVLQVRGVEGVRLVDGLVQLPSLLRDLSDELIDRYATLDRDFVGFLEATRIAVDLEGEAA